MANGRVNGKQIIDDTVIKTINGLTFSDQYITSNNDSNVTLTVATSGSTHSLTVGWSGLLPISRGGLNNATFTASQILITSTNSVISSGYIFNDIGTSSTDIWSAEKIDTKYLTQYGDKIFATTSGTNTYTATLTPPITSYVEGMSLYVKFNSENTGTSSLNINGLGAKTILKNGFGLSASNIKLNDILNLLYDGTYFQIVAASSTIRSTHWVDPSRVTSGTAFTLTLATNDRIIRTLSGSNLTNTSYMEFVIPEDFIGFPTNAYSLDSIRDSTNANIVVTFGKNGVADSTIDSLSLVATGTGNTVWETKSATPGSTYSPGDRILITMKSTTSGNVSVSLSSARLKYIAR